MQAQPPLAPMTAELPTGQHRLHRGHAPLGLLLAGLLEEGKREKNA